jgi:RNA polymerase sigma factor (sigma-70 family)
MTVEDRVRELQQKYEALTQEMGLPGGCDSVADFMERAKEILERLRIKPRPALSPLEQSVLFLMEEDIPGLWLEIEPKLQRNPKYRLRSFGDEWADLTLEWYPELMESVVRFRFESKFITFLWPVIDRASIKRFKKLVKTKKREIGEDPKHLAMRKVFVPLSFESPLAKIEVTRLIARYEAEFPDEQENVQILVQHVVEGMSFGEISKETGILESTCRSREFRIRQLFRKWLMPEDRK